MRHLFALPLPLPLSCIMLAACATATPVPPQVVTLAPQASARVAPGITLTYEGVDDSRCPPGVRCVWAGTLDYRFRLQGEDGVPERFTLLPERPGHASPLLHGARIELDDALAAAPPPRDAVQTTPVTLRLKPA